SGMSDKPMQDSRGVIRFFAPESLSQEITLPNAGQMKGLAIPKGINLIVGGGYHGKSTLLQALETGIYNHVPGDGREYCVSNLKTVKIRAYTGRPVVKTDVSMFINDLPFQQDTTSFCTNNASGSTSQAAYIVEAMEIGAEVLLMDEDTCAANFMIRDHKMQQLVDKKEEPITAFIDKVKRLHTEKNISTVLVLGGVGDYFSVADHVIQMKAYQPFDVTSKARQIVFDSLQARAIEDNANQICFRKRIPIADSIVPFNRYHKFSVSAKETHRLLFGGSLVDLTDVEQLIELSQTKALAYAMAYAKKFMDGKTILRDVVDKVIRDIENNGLDILSERISGQFAVFRSMELAFALNRLANLKIKQKDE
ncbi:MAG TPA: ATPase, partial [Gammaproteobacteria bacterium]|nr:ATPase [Gammaproteobacteria bacterium]